MADEVTWQRKIAKQLVNEGGYGKKWSSSYATGVPDLILATPESGLFVSEAKLERDWNKNTVRTLQLTDRQGLELNLIANGGGATSVILIFEETSRSVYLNLFARPKLRDTIQINRNQALEGAYKWQTKSGLREWLNKRLEHVK